MLEPVQESSLWPWQAYLPLLRIYYRGATTQLRARDQVALTFDDGPDERFTPAILEALAQHGARATFFMLGAQVEQAPELAAQVAERGHELAVHLFSHDRAVARDDARFAEELRRTVELVQRAAGRRPRFLRMPFAYLGRQLPHRITRDHDLEVVHWSFSSMDSRYDPARIVKRFRNAVFPGAIVLLHDGVGPGSSYANSRQNTVDALPGILRACKEQGLTCVTMSGMTG